MTPAKRALVTGSAGFIGRHFAAELERRGCIVSRCDIVTSWDALNIFRQDVMTDCIERYDLVVHAAARAPHRAAIDGQPATHLYNQLLDAAMFDWAVRTGQGRVLYLSSSSAYPADLQRHWRAPHRLWEGDCGPDFAPGVDDNDQLTPDGTYGWTKLTGERLADSARAAGVPVTVVRPFSGYGEDQATDWPFGAFVDRARRREDPFPLWNAEAVRDWIHVDDVVAGALAVVESGTDDPVNLCTGVGTSCGDLAAMVADAAGYRPAFAPQGDKPAGVAYRVGDPARLHRYYQPQVSIEAGVKRALATGGDR